jgi:2-amino-4-hydroxy-6-hydroxymethyldihydropteridine diphosphokinase
MRDVAFIALGSNLGDREAHLAAGRGGIARLPGTRVLAVSAIEETEPLGPPQPRYLNQMIAIETELAPRALMDALLDIERAAGRERRERWGPRTLDLDIVRFASQSVSEPGLEVPHPGLRDRDFWQRELAELTGQLSVE